MSLLSLKRRLKMLLIKTKITFNTFTKTKKDIQQVSYSLNKCN